MFFPVLYGYETLTSKLEAVWKVQEYITQLEMCYTKVQGVMADNGTELINSEFKNYLLAKGVVLFTSVPYMPQQNGIAERGICTITEGDRSMLYATKIVEGE
jgi:hypothetical protein